MGDTGIVDTAIVDTAVVDAKQSVNVAPSIAPSVDAAPIDNRSTLSIGVYGLDVNGDIKITSVAADTAQTHVDDSKVTRGSLDVVTRSTVARSVIRRAQVDGATRVSAVSLGTTPELLTSINSALKRSRPRTSLDKPLRPVATVVAAVDTVPTVPTVPTVATVATTHVGRVYSGTSDATVMIVQSKYSHVDMGEVIAPLGKATAVIVTTDANARE